MMKWLHADGESIASVEDAMALLGELRQDDRLLGGYRKRVGSERWVDGPAVQVAPRSGIAN
jgi:hypothetical protein